MKATVDIPDDLYRKLKVLAITRDTTVKKLMAEGVRLVLRSVRTGRGRRRLRFPLISSGAPGTLKIPDDVVARLDEGEDRERQARSLRRRD